jgi:hypothetical protein
MILATYTKQPDEELDYDVDCSPWLPSGDTIDESVTPTVTIYPSGELAVLDPMPILNGRAIKHWVSGGLNGSTYKVEVTFRTNGGRVKQYELRFRVKDY